MPAEVAPSRRLLADAVLTRLRTLSGLNVYDGEVDEAVPTIPDGSGRVQPYAVVYPSPGTPVADVDLGDTVAALDWMTQVTVAAGHRADLLHAVDRVHGALHRWAPPAASLGGVVAGWLRPPLGYDPGPVQRDDTVKPSRFWLPLQYALIATA